MVRSEPFEEHKKPAVGNFGCSPNTEAQCRDKEGVSGTVSAIVAMVC